MNCRALHKPKLTRGKLRMQRSCFTYIWHCPSFKNCPRFPGVHHFRNGVTSLKYITGSEHGQILRVSSNIVCSRVCSLQIVPPTLPRRPVARTSSSAITAPPTTRVYSSLRQVFHCAYWGLSCSFARTHHSLWWTDRGNCSDCSRTAIVFVIYKMDRGFMTKTLASISHGISTTH